MPPSFEDTAQNLHNALDGKAYTPEYINNILFEDKDKYSPCASRTTCIINDAYFASYLQDIQDCAIIIELYELYSPYLESHKYNLHIPFIPILTELNTNDLSSHLIKSSFSDVLKLKGDDKFMAVVANAIARYCRSTRDYHQLHSINNNTHTTNYFINNAPASQFGVNCSSTSMTTRPPTNTDENGKPRERIMPNTFINNGTVGMMGENNTNNGDITGQQNTGITPEHWEAICKEIRLIIETKKTLNYDQIQKINNAVEQKDPVKLSNVLRICNISRDFVISLGASIVENMMHLQ